MSKHTHNVLITGASSGIGRSLCLELAKRNVNIIAISRNQEKLESLVSAHENIIIIPFDLTSFSQYDQLKEIITKEVNCIDVLINNAGALINKPFEQMTIKDFNTMVDVNYKAPYFLTKLLLPLMLKSVIKKIINIGSIGGVDNTDKFPGLSIYSSSKAAIGNVTECLAKELSPKGFMINCLALGAVKTEMLQKAFPGYNPETTSEKMAILIAEFVMSHSQIINGKVLQLGGVEI